MEAAPFAKETPNGRIARRDTTSIYSYAYYIMHYALCILYYALYYIRIHTAR